MTCCLINGLALVAEEQIHHSFQYQHATTLPIQYSRESCRVTQQVVRTKDPKGPKAVRTQPARKTLGPFTKQEKQEH